MVFESNVNSFRALLASVTAGLAGTLVYRYLMQSWFGKQDALQKSPASILHVEVPHDTVAYLIGRDGSNIKTIENQTTTCISFVDPGGPYRLCVIRGSNEGIQAAKELILKSVEEYAQLETSEICVSQKIIDHLTANENKKLREIAVVSKTRVYIYRVEDKPNSLLVRGLYHQIEEVRSILKQLTVEDGVLEKSSPTIPSNRSSITSFNDSIDNQVISSTQLIHEELEATSSDGFCEVMISMVQSPSKFFVQKAGPQSKELDRLIEAMTAFYSDENNRQQCLSSMVEVDKLVAVFISDDNCWYRSRIISVEWDDIERKDSFLKVQLLDFGDVVTVQLCNLAQLTNEHLVLRAQAIECRLAKIKPLTEEWTDAAVEIFESLTYCTLWKIVMAKIELYTQGVGGKRVPCIQIIDTNSEMDVDIAAELIRRELGAFVPT